MRAGALILAALALAAALVFRAAPGDNPTGGIVRVHAGDEVATGFLHDGRLVTVAHVLDRDTRALRVDRAADLAWLPAAGARPLPAPRTAGTAVLVVRGGGVAALPAKVRRRIVAHVENPRGPASDTPSGSKTRAALELEADVEAGDSGAPVVSGGRLLGVVFARSNDRPHTAYAVALAG